MPGPERPFRPVDPALTSLASFDLHGLAEQLRRDPQYQKDGRAGIALARDAHVSVVLEALRRGSELHEHHTPSSAMVTLLSGRARFLTEGGAQHTGMVPGTLVVFAAGLEHAVVAEEDSALLIVIGGREG